MEKKCKALKTIINKTRKKKHFKCTFEIYLPNCKMTICTFQLMLGVQNHIEKAFNIAMITSEENIPLQN